MALWVINQYLTTEQVGQSLAENAIEITSLTLMVGCVKTEISGKIYKQGATRIVGI